MNDPQTTIRKAAILVASVDGNTAEALLSQMGAAEAAAVRRAAAALDGIGEEERDLVLDEFRELTGVQASAAHPLTTRSTRARNRLIPSVQPTGIDLCGPQAQRFAASLAEEAGSDESMATAFSRLQQTGSDVLAGFLSREQPQTVAVVFMRLAPHQAAEVLRQLPDVLQTEVVERLATTDQADPQVLREVEQGLETWLLEQTQGSRRPTVGISTATRVLEAASYDLRQSVLANLARRDASLARKLAGSPLRPVAAPRSAGTTFDDLLQADDATLATLIAAADGGVATLALAGANELVMRRIERRLPENHWSLLRARVDNLGPTTLRAVESAQQQLVVLALELEAQGKIDLSSLRPVDVTA